MINQEVAMAGARRFEVDDVLYPFDSHWYEWNGARMHYVDEGEGLPVVMLHGNPTWSFLYRKVIQKLKGKCRCIAPDYPGFGLSDHPKGYGYTPQEHAGWVKALLDHLELDRYVLIMQDWGGPIGLANAVEHPERVAGMLLLNTWCWPAHMNALVFSLVMGGPFREWMHQKHNFFARRVIPWGISSGSKYDPDVIDAYLAPFATYENRRGTAEFPYQIRKSAAWLASIEKRLKLLKQTPKEMFRAMKDPAFGSNAYIHRWRSYFPDIFTERVKDASHYLQEDCPDKIVEGLERVFEMIATRESAEPDK
jgi:haloalkane dehalogenase